MTVLEAINTVRNCREFTVITLDGKTIAYYNVSSDQMTTKGRTNPPWDEKVNYIELTNNGCLLTLCGESNALQTVL